MSHFTQSTLIKQSACLMWSIYTINFFFYQALLAEALDEDDQKRPEQEMEITFEPGLQETAEELVQRKLGGF